MDELSQTPASLLAQVPYLAQLTLELRADVSSLRGVAHSLELRMAEMGVVSLRGDIEDLQEVQQEHSAFKNRATGAFWVAQFVWGALFAVFLIYFSSRFPK